MLENTVKGERRKREKLTADDVKRGRYKKLRKILETGSRENEITLQRNARNIITKSVNNLPKASQ